MEPETKGIRYQSATFPTVQGLMHYVNEQTLMVEHRKQARKKATGIDGIDKVAYDENAEENIKKLISKMKKFRYRPQAVRRTYIPKGNGKMRPLGIPAYEDRLVQGVMAGLLNEVYETRFLDCSYGFRPKRNAHDWLMEFLAHDIQDKNFLRYIKRFLIAGIMEGTELLESDRRTPQSGLISPVLANVYLHYVLDLWFEKAIKLKLRGEAYYVRYADDFLILFQYEDEAQAVLNMLRSRLGKFSLELAEEKTRILPIGRFKGTKEDFDFLGFTFYNTTTRGGKYRLGIRSSKKKLKAKRQAAKECLRTRLTKPVTETMKLLAAIIRGHCNYYGVNGNFRAIQNFWKHLQYATYQMLNRRDQKGKLKYLKFLRIWDYYIPEPHLTKDIWNWKPKVS